MDCEVHSGGEEDQGQRHIRWVNWYTPLAVSHHCFVSRIPIFYITAPWNHHVCIGILFLSGLIILRWACTIRHQFMWWSDYEARVLSDLAPNIRLQMVEPKNGPRLIPLCPVGFDVYGCAACYWGSPTEICWPAFCCRQILFVSSFLAGWKCLHLCTKCHSSIDSSVTSDCCPELCFLGPQTHVIHFHTPQS